MKKIIVFGLLLIVIVLGGCKSKDISSMEEINCTVNPGPPDEYGKYNKVIFSYLNWEDYDQFFVSEITIQYGYGPNRFETTSAWQSAIVIKSFSNDVLGRYEFSDPRAQVYFCEPGADCPEPQFLKNGEDLFIINYFTNMKTIELYEANDPPLANSIIARYLPGGYTLDGKQLLSIEISNCFKAFCEEVADTQDPDCS